jgi:hypothetical protein
MKKSITLIVAILSVVALSVACKSHERCPAYGKTAPDSQEVKA